MITQASRVADDPLSESFDLLTGRLPTKAFLGSCLLDQDQFDRCRGMIAERHLHGHFERLVWLAMNEQRDAGIAFDPVVLTDRVTALDGAANPNDVAVAVLELFEAVYHSANATEYAKQLLESWKRREAVSAATELQRLARDPSTSPDEALSRHGERLERLTEGATTDLQVSIRDTIGDTLRALAEGKERFTPTDFSKFDEMLRGGFRAGLLAILAARPSMGKTALAVSLLLSIARRGAAAGFISLEMAVAELESRLLVQLSRVPLAHMRSASAADRASMAEAAAELSNLPIVWDERSATLDQVVSSIRRMRRVHGAEVVFIDYLQLIEPPDRRVVREQQVSCITRRLKLLARETGVCIVALSQLSRALELRTIKTPQLSDLRESGSIEQDADVVCFLHRPHVYDQNEPATLAKLVIAKQRSGPTGSVDLEWHAWCTQFVSAAPEALE